MIYYGRNSPVSAIVFLAKKQTYQSISFVIRESHVSYVVNNPGNPRVKISDPYPYPLDPYPSNPRVYPSKNDQKQPKRSRNE